MVEKLKEKLDVLAQEAGASPDLEALEVCTWVPALPGSSCLSSTTASDSHLPFRVSLRAAFSRLAAARAAVESHPSGRHLPASCPSLPLYTRLIDGSPADPPLPLWAAAPPPVTPSPSSSARLLHGLEVFRSRALPRDTRLRRQA